MQTSPYAKAGLLALVLLVGFLVGWEAHLRRQGFGLSYNDDEALWAYHRQRVYETGAASPVIVGSSRVKFGLDLAAWEAATGAAPVQLAMVGTAPRPLLADLAQDVQFKGTVLMGVTEGLFFAPDRSPPDERARKSVAFYSKWSLAQQAGFVINRELESRLLFLDEDLFSLSGLLNLWAIPNRPGVSARPPFPQKFKLDRFNRQTSMTPAFLADTAMQHQVQSIWMGLMNGPARPMPDSVLNGIFKTVSADVARIRGRGGKVIFVRMPSSNLVWEKEQQACPRAKYWDRLLRETGAPGIHFADYPELSAYNCPEWSHLSPADARTFTRDLVRIMAQKTEWPVISTASAAAQPEASTLTVR